MRSIAKGDLIGGILTVGFGAAVLVHVRTFPQLPGGQPGPALFPGIIGALMVVFGLVLSARSLKAASPDPAAPTKGVNWAGVINASAVLAAIIVYIFAADLLGFAPTMIILLGLLMWRFGTRPLIAVGAAVITTAFITGVFRFVLLVPLPQGPLGF